MDWVAPSIEIVKLVGGRFVRYLKYQIKYNDLLQKFERSKQGLRSRRDDIQSKREAQLESAPYHVGTVEVEDWLKEVEEFIRRQDVVDEVNSWGYLSCCCRAVILEERTQELKEIYDRGDNYTRDCLVIEDHSKKLKMLLGEKIREMERMCEEGSQLPDCLVIDDPSALAVELPVSKLQGNEAVIEEISACLKGEEVAKLGVWGMGGIGKTTIMKHIHNELQKQPKFKKIIWVTVSKDSNIYNLQEQIADCLKEQLPKDQNIAMRAGRLFQMLKEDKHKPFLLILDDVWESFDLNEVGIPKLDLINGCKLVLTTLSQEVARSMGCSSIIKVETLLGKEALELFLNKVGDTILSDHGGGIKKDLESTLKEIVDECDGLPLALITVAGNLKGISESQLWRVALNQLRDCKRNVAGKDDDDAFRILKFSYDRLRNQQMRYCFLYCALYPEDYKIPQEKIIESWIDEGFIDEMEPRQSMKDEGYGILQKLEDNSLLELIKDDFRRPCVRMHDLIRDMALDITRMSPQFLVEASKALKELLEKVKCAKGAEKVSLMHNYIEEIPSSLAFSTCIRLTTLLLAHNKLSTIPESVFEHMPELKILDLSFNQRLSSLPNSISKLVKLTTLLLESTSLEKVPSLSGLGSLKKLNLRGTKIKEVPEGLGTLKNLECLFLCGLEGYYGSSGSHGLRGYYGSRGYYLEIDEIADEVLSNLSKLQELIVNKSRIKLKGDVVGRLKKLEVFHSCFPTVNEMRVFLKCQPNRLSDYFINVGRREYLLLFHHFQKMLPLRYKKVVVFTETSIVGENMLFPSIQILGVEACDDIRSLNDFSTINDATDLRECWINSCKGMECIFPSWISKPVVQTVEYLDLQNLHKLDGLFEANIIVKSSPPPGTFSSLKVVWIFSCKKLKKLFPSWKLVEYLQSLERIEVLECEEMKEIIGSDPEEEGEEGGDIIKKLILPKLKELKLWKLPALKSICSRKAVMVCDSLESFRISNCNHLRRIPFHLPPCLSLNESDWVFEVELIAMSPPQPCTFSSLKEIKIRKCRRAKQLFPSWKFLEYLQSLEKIDVSDCEEMEEIIGSDPEEGEEGGDIIKKLILPKLKELELWNLPALKSIYSRRAVMVCDFLESITILNCKGLRSIPLYIPLVDNAQPSPPPSLKKIRVIPQEWWESLEWDHPNAKDVLRPMVRFGL
ncbi:hypothetical protein SLA2020_079550 [Shorea laevis]